MNDCNRKISQHCCRSLHGERGLKFFICREFSVNEESLPSRGAWIEITYLIKVLLLRFCRSLHGERGLKFYCVKNLKSSLSRSLHGERGLKSELYFAIFSPLSRSLHGERGLKFLSILIILLCTYVAPFTGSVDWNSTSPAQDTQDSVAPFTGSVDWNNRNLIRKTHREVAPFTGSVDWNRGVSRQNGWCLGSLPSRGAWIEIPNQGVLFFCSRSLPSRGAWIEISLHIWLYHNVHSRSLHGERGLKFC